METAMKTCDAALKLLARMTLAEKIGQLNFVKAGEGIATGAARTTPLAARLDAGEVGAISGTRSRASARALQERALAGSRLRIPLFFTENVIHGHRTVFPLPVALACSWDLGLIEETAAFAAAEAASDGLHHNFGPMIDVARDPRWGRVAESPGEDPLLASRIAAAMTRGFQGADPAAPGRLGVCIKHFVAYGATQSGRDYDNASLAWEDLVGVYLPPFEAAVAAGAVSVMAAFNAVNKVPMHAHHALIEGWLRGRAGFDGVVIADYTGVMELSAHGIGDSASAVARALHAGVDMDLVGEDYLRELPRLAEVGIDAPDCGFSLTADRIVGLIDRACLRVLSLKARLGLLDDPFRNLGDAAPAAPTGGRALARRAAAQSAVLLKNDGILPLPAKRRVALIGPFAGDRANMLGTWAVKGDARDVRTLAEAMADRPDVALDIAHGANIVDEPWLVDRLNVFGAIVVADARGSEALIAEAVRAASAADVAVVAIGEAKEHAGESSARIAPDIPAPQRRLVDALAETGTPLVVVVFAGRPLALGRIPQQAAALIYAWHGGIGGPEGVCDLIFGDAEPAGRLAVTLPVHPGEVPLHHAAEPTGRPFPGRFQKFLTGWLDLDDAVAGAAYPFGFGLTYGDVRYGRPRLSSERARGEADRVILSVDVANRGDRPAVETVQLYLSDPVARITRPARMLKDFRRVPLAPGDERTVQFDVTHDMLRYPLAPSLEAAELVWDPGEIILHVGPNSRDTQQVSLQWDA
jgi:beta-glucosidase